MNRGIAGTFDLIHVVGGIVGVICNIMGVVGMKFMKPCRETGTDLSTLSETTCAVTNCTLTWGCGELQTI